MKCEICDEEIVVVYEALAATSGDGKEYKACRPKFAELRCDCYDCEGFPDCDYHLVDGVVTRKEQPPPGPFDRLVMEFIVPPLIEWFNQPSILEQIREQWRKKEPRCEE